MASVAIWVSSWSVVDGDLKAGVWGMEPMWKWSSCKRVWGPLWIVAVLSKTLRILFLAFSPICFFPSSNGILFLIYKTSAQPSRGSVGLALSY